MAPLLDQVSGATALLARITNLTPGDFAAVTRRLKSLREVPSAHQLLSELRTELRVKEATAGKIGF